MADLTAHDSAELNPIEGEVDDSRRKFLLRATIGMGVVGAAFTATPFIESWLPSERARALGGPTQVDVTKIEAGQMIITIWRRQPMFVVHRTPGMMALLGNHDDRLKDAASADSDQPAYCKNPIRSRNAERAQDRRNTVSDIEHRRADRRGRGSSHAGDVDDDREESAIQKR